MSDAIKLHAIDVTDEEAIYTTAEAADMRRHVGHVIRCEARNGGARVICATCGHTILVATEAVDLAGVEVDDG